MLEQPETASVGELTDIKQGQSAYKKAILSFDNLGIFASVLCLIHCMAMPFVVALLPFIGLRFLDSHESHLWLAGFIIGFALAAIVPGYLKHRKVAILLGMLAGISLVLSGSFLSEVFHTAEYELWILITGNLLLVATHLFNKRLFSGCDHDHNH